MFPENCLYSLNLVFFVFSKEKKKCFSVFGVFFLLLFFKTKKEFKKIVTKHNFRFSW